MRLPKLTADLYTARQHELAERISGPRGQVRGPFLCLMHSPEVLDRVEALASHLRFRSSLPEKLREFSLLIAARFWDAQDSWQAHSPKAIAAGLPAGIVEALADRRPPPFEDEDERMFYQFCKELLETHFVGDATYAAARARFGDEGLVDTVACLGTFSMLAMTLNAFQVDLDPAKAPPFADIRGYVRVGERQPLG